MTETKDWKSVAITGEVMGVGTTTQKESLAKALGLPIIPSGGSLRRNLSHTWKKFREQPKRVAQDEKIVWQEFQKGMMGKTILIISIEHNEQSEDDLKEFDRVENAYVDETSRRFWETLIDRESISPLLEPDSPKIAEGKLLAIAKKLRGLEDITQDFNDLVVRFILTVRDKKGRIDLHEVGRRILEREIRNLKVNPPEGKHEKEAMIISTVSKSLVRNQGHWDRWKEVYGVRWEDIGEESEKENVHTINTKGLSALEVQLAMRLIYLDETPQSASVLLDSINKLLNQIEAERRVEEVSPDIGIHAPTVASAILNYSKLTTSS